MMRWEDYHMFEAVLFYILNFQISLTYSRAVSKHRSTTTKSNTGRQKKELSYVPPPLFSPLKISCCLALGSDSRVLRVGKRIVFIILSVTFSFMVQLSSLTKSRTKNKRVRSQCSWQEFVILPNDTGLLIRGSVQLTEQRKRKPLLGVFGIRRDTLHWFSTETQWLFNTIHLRISRVFNTWKLGLLRTLSVPFIWPIDGIAWKLIVWALEFNSQIFILTHILCEVVKVSEPLFSSFCTTGMTIHGLMLLQLGETRHAKCLMWVWSY